MNGLHEIWDFLNNSPVGIAIVSTVLASFLATVVGLVLRRRPKWQKTYDTYRPYLFDAVRFAEQVIPDSTPGAVGKMDRALKFLLTLEPSLAKANEADLKRALTEAHDKLEEKKLETLKATGMRPVVVLEDNTTGGKKE